MAKRTNKTSHVLNLLIQPEEGEQPGGGEETEAKQPARKEEKQEEVSLKIRDELMKEIEGEEQGEKAPEPPKADPPGEMENGLKDGEEKVLEKPGQPPRGEGKEPEAGGEGAVSGGEKKKDAESFHYVNVMEELVRRMNLDPTQYGVCGCSRCRADVMALMLTTLPAKYVIVQDGAVAPLLNYYENKFKVQLLTAAIKACIKVKDNPHHGRD